ncbi:MAG: pyridoxine 5'-phosphate synthase [Pseudomonadota bacterium]|nr:pyridoxine 5'-phosphate synthase [Pseudomonadota bacterium]
MSDQLGINCHAGHGLCFDTVRPIAANQRMLELNIDHSLRGEAMFSGKKKAILRMPATCCW